MKVKIKSIQPRLRQNCKALSGRQSAWGLALDFSLNLFEEGHMPSHSNCSNCRVHMPNEGLEADKKLREI